MFQLLVLALLLAAFAYGLVDNFKRTGFRPPASSMQSPAFGGLYYTILQGVGLTGAIAITLTHSLGITPASLVCRPIIRQAAITNTGWPQVVSLGTNFVQVAIGPAQTLTTMDVEVQQIHSIID